MNWLAHLYLSEPSAEFRFGNLLPDFGIDPRYLVNVPEAMARGMERHHQIDRFTDQHDIVRGSIRRLEAPWRGYGGVLVDIFYDHYLAANWSVYSTAPLSGFISETYQSFETFYSFLPAETKDRLLQMRTEDWLGAYGTVEGIETTLRRVSHRFRRPIELARAVGELERNYEVYGADFRAFFPQLRSRFPVTADESARHNLSQ